MSRAWYASTTKPAAEDLAEKELLRQGFTVFNPHVRLAVRTHRGDHRLVVRPYLPGYILINFNAERDCWRSINWTRGIGKLFTCGEVPLRIRTGVVEQMIERVSEDGYAVDQKLDDVVISYFRTGDRVKLSSGSFVGFEADVVMTSRDKVLVMLEAFGRRTKTTVPVSSLQRVN